LSKCLDRKFYLGLLSKFNKNIKPATASYFYLQDIFKIIIDDIKNIILSGKIPKNIKVLTSIDKPAIKPAILNINFKEN